METIFKHQYTSCLFYGGYAPLWVVWPGKCQNPTEGINPALKLKKKFSGDPVFVFFLVGFADTPSP